MKKVLLLGYNEGKIYNFLNKKSKLINLQKKVSLQEIREIEPDIIISYGYRRIISKDIVNEYDGRLFNLHVSYLPWNKGAYPNLWSIVDNTPKGVTIHLIDQGIDTGDVLFQQQVSIANTDTLRSSYKKLKDAIEDLFIEKWEQILNLNFERKKQKPDGTFHLKKTSKIYFGALSALDNWEMTVSELKERSDEEIIEEIRKIREKNNTHWMDVVKLAFRLSPRESRDIFKKIKFCDAKINELLKELATNESK